MSSFLELPDELILKVFSYTETADILRCCQVSKRIRTISNDNSLFQTVNLSNKIVKTDFLATLLKKGCKSLNLSGSALWGDLTVIPKSQLGILDLSNCRSIHVWKWYISRSMCKCETCIVSMLKSTTKLSKPAEKWSNFYWRAYQNDLIISQACLSSAKLVWF